MPTRTKTRPSVPRPRRLGRRLAIGLGVLFLGGLLLSAVPRRPSTPVPPAPEVAAAASTQAATAVPTTAPAPPPAPTRPAVPTTPPAAPTIAPAPKAPQASLTRTCGDFTTWREAQDYYEQLPASGRARLDQDRDGVACETLPGAPAQRK